MANSTTAVWTVQLFRCSSAVSYSLTLQFNGQLNFPCFILWLTHTHPILLIYSTWNNIWYIQSSPIGLVELEIGLLLFLRNPRKPYLLLRPANIHKFGKKCKVEYIKNRKTSRIWENHLQNVFRVMIQTYLKYYTKIKVIAIALVITYRLSSSFHKQLESRDPSVIMLVR